MESITKRTVAMNYSKESFCNKVVSEGTLRTSDLIRAFSRTLAEIEPDIHARIFERRDYQRVADVISRGSSYVVDYGLLAETARSLLDTLDVELGANAPDGYYFGTPEGWGACFGFWPLNDDEEIVVLADK